MRYWLNYTDTTLLEVVAGVAALVGLLLVLKPSDGFPILGKIGREENPAPEMYGGIYFNEKVMADKIEVRYPPGYDISQEVLAAQLLKTSQGLRRQEEILRSIYFQGLRQSRISFNLSMTFATLGGALIFSGVALAVFRGSSEGAQYASVVTALSGTVSTLTAALFFAQANAARKSMGEQAVLLREESQVDRHISTAREMVALVTDGSVRDKLQAEMAQSLIGLVVSQNKPNDRSP